MTDTMEQVDSETKRLDPGDDGNQAAHMVRKEDQMMGYVFGQEVTALCGLKFVPTKDPNKRPRCQACLDAWAKLRGLT